MTTPQLCLGKLAKISDPRTLNLKAYLATLPQVPKTCAWIDKVPDWGMLGNDRVGDCTIASALHLMMLWYSEQGTQLICDGNNAISEYSKITGYKPGDPSTDQGAVCLGVLKAWRNDGICGFKINSFVETYAHELDLLRAAIYIFGGVYAGVGISHTAEMEFQTGCDWSHTTDDPRGGHAIPLVGYDETSFTCITWGRKQRMSIEWWLHYADEAYVPFCPLWLDKAGNSPCGFNQQQLATDLALLN